MDTATRIFFTSDTHFTSPRTLKLSCRPFKDISDMDFRLISNWNNKVSENDIVFHLGDFGRQDIVHQLNFCKMYFIPGNYERASSGTKELEADSRVTIISPDELAHFMDPMTEDHYYLIHEPLFHTARNDETLQMLSDPGTFYLFGHIHKLQLVKRNGINISCDAHGFTPVSLEEIRFLRRAVEKHFDENVFTDYCRPIFN